MWRTELFFSALVAGQTAVGMRSTITSSLALDFVTVLVVSLVCTYIVYETFWYKHEDIMKL